MIDTEKAKSILGLNKDEQWVAPSVVVNTRKGLALVCYEGVGWFADKDKVYKILVGDEWNDWVRDITEEQLLSIISDEETTLHQLIDPYNDRTRANLSLWQNVIEGYDQNVVGSNYNVINREVANV